MLFSKPWFKTQTPLASKPVVPPHRKASIWKMKTYGAGNVCKEKTVTGWRRPLYYKHTTTSHNLQGKVTKDQFCPPPFPAARRRWRARRGSNSLQKMPTGIKKRQKYLGKCPLGVSLLLKDVAPFCKPPPTRHLHHHRDHHRHHRRRLHPNIQKNSQQHLRTYSS